jgi:hypothetical protein
MQQHGQEKTDPPTFGAHCFRVLQDAADLQLALENQSVSMNPATRIMPNSGGTACAVRSV